MAMVKVKMRTTLAGPEAVILAGAVASLPEALASMLIEHGYAELVAPAASADVEGDVEHATIAPDETATAKPQRTQRRKSPT